MSSPRIQVVSCYGGAFVTRPRAREGSPSLSHLALSDNIQPTHVQAATTRQPYAFLLSRFSTSFMPISSSYSIPITDTPKIASTIQKLRHTALRQCTCTVYKTVLLFVRKDMAFQSKVFYSLSHLIAPFLSRRPSRWNCCCLDQPLALSLFLEFMWHCQSVTWGNFD
jgi:hypothetical protein